MSSRSYLPGILIFTIRSLYNPIQCYACRGVCRGQSCCFSQFVNCQHVTILARKDVHKKVCREAKVFDMFLKVASLSNVVFSQIKSSLSVALMSIPHS